MKKLHKIIFSLLLSAVLVINTCYPTLAEVVPNIFSGLSAYVLGEAADNGDDIKPSITIIPPETVKISDRYVKFAANVTDNNALADYDPVVVYYRADETLPYKKVLLTKENDSDIYSANVDTYVQYGTAKENKKFFTDKIFYYVEAVDANGNVAETQVNIVKCDQYYGDVIDYNNVPYLLITELVVGTTAKGIGNGDKFEFVEIYNNSDTPINFSGYELHYMTMPSVRPAEYALKNPENRELIIQPRSAIVIWVNTNDWQNKGALPPQEMLEYYYGTQENPKENWNLATDFEFVAEGADANLSYSHFAGQPNSGQHRGWGVYTNTGELVVEAYYNMNNDTSNNTDVSYDMGIQFRYPVDGGKRMQKISANTVYGSPGRVLDYQVPTATVDMPTDTEDPVINYSHRNVDIYSVESDGINHEIWASVTDDTIVNTVYIEYKVSSPEYESPYTTLQSFLRDGETSFYCAYMDFGKFIRQSQIEFRIEARDIVGKVTQTDWYVLNIIPYEDPTDPSTLRSNINDGAYLKGDIALSATNGAGLADDISMTLDGEAVAAKEDSERYALFVYEVFSTDFNFLNGVTIKNSALGDDNKILFNFDISGKWTTYTVRIPLDMILPTEENPNGGLIGLHSGNRYTPVSDIPRFLDAINNYRIAKAANDAAGMAEAKKDFIYGDMYYQKQYSEEIDESGLNLNRDDYDFRNVRLILADGTILYDTNPANSGKFAELDVDEIYKLGDGGSSDIRQYYFNFDIPESQINTKSYRVDSTALTDGEHTLTVSNGDEIKTINFFIDNTAPTFEFGFDNEEVLKGTITLLPEITENGSGIGKCYGYLDGNRIGIPYYTRSGDLEAGLHTLEVTIEDKVGNSTTRTTSFYTEEENPYPPIVNENNQIVNGVDAQLSVTVTDPSNDNLKVEFFEGYKYSSENTSVFKGYHNSVDMEPIPYVVYPGEVEFTAEQYNKISSLDGQYFDSQSYQLPYHRFSVTVDNSLPRNGSVDVRWYGKSLAGRKVTLYAWNLIEEEWDAIDYLIAKDDDFMLEGSLIIESYVNVKDSTVNILIQDEIVEASTEKFTFAWITDQQYYVQRDAYDDEDHIIMELQHNWLIENKEALNLQYVFNTGDIVNRKDEDYQWDIADEYFRLLENARIPYGVTTGNHDVNFSQEDHSKYGEVFGEERYKDKPWYGESYQNNKGHYDTISVNGLDFMMVYMGWGIYDSEIKWMNKVISENPDKTVILNLHEYLGTSGVLTDPGQYVYDNVVIPNPNVKMVLCGHLHGSASRVDSIDDNGDGIADRKVWQLLADYQGLKNTASKYDGGDGFMRLFEFDSATGEVNVVTTSPWLEYLNELKGLNTGDEGAYNINQALNSMAFEGLQGDGLAQNGNGTGSAYKSMDVEANSFVYEWDLVPQIKRVATDAVYVFYRKEESLGVIENVPSNGTVSFDWKGLEANKTYDWFVVISDENGGEYISDMYTFTTGESSSIKPLTIGLIIGGGVLILSGSAFIVIRKLKIKSRKTGGAL